MSTQLIAVIELIVSMSRTIPAGLIDCTLLCTTVALYVRKITATLLVCSSTPDIILQYWPIRMLTQMLDAK